MADDDIRFEQQFLLPGYSGGALVDSRGSLAGMIRSDAPPLGSALPLPAIRQRFKAWQLPFFLKAYDDVSSDARRCKRRLPPETDFEKVNPFVIDCGSD